LCEAPSGPFRQIGPVPFFPPKIVQSHLVRARTQRKERGDEGGSKHDRVQSSLLATGNRKRKMRRFTTLALLLILVSAISQLSKADTVVYDNTTTLWHDALGNASVFGWTGSGSVGWGVEWGDEVHLAGSARIGKHLEILMYCSGDITTETILSLYDNTGIDGAPNNLLWTADLGNVDYSSLTTLSAPLPGVILPDTVTWTFKCYSYNPEVFIGNVLYDPPSVGSSEDWYWYNLGSGFQSSPIDGLVANFGAKIIAVVPEPSTLALLGVGVISLFAYAWRLRQRSQRFQC
jgi:hypothetical protein